MVTVTDEMKRHCNQCLKRIEEHLRDYPLSETYFAARAGSSPYVIRNLRDGVLVKPETIDKIYNFIEERERKLRSPKSTAAE